MKEYKLVQLNEEMHLSLKRDLEDAEKVLNHYAKEGWMLQQIVPIHDISSPFFAVLYKEDDQLY